MRILRVITTLDPRRGGVAESVIQSIAPLNRIGHTVDVASFDDPKSEFLERLEFKVHALGPPVSNYGFCPRFTAWLRRNRCSYDAVVVDGIWQYHSLAVRNALHNTDTPYFVVVHGMLGPWFKSRYPFKHVKKWLYWPWADYRVLRDARAVIYTCEEERRLARESFCLYQANEVVARLGTTRPSNPPAELANRFLSRYPDLRSKRFLLFLGRIHSVKGIDLLISAFSEIVDEFPEIHLVLAGPDPTGMRDSLQRRVDAAGATDRVHWTGMLDTTTKWGALIAADAFILPSHHENFGIVVAEALSCEKPVLISNKVNIWRDIVESDCGFVAEDTIEGTLCNLRSWLRLSPTEAQRMRRLALQCFETRFHSDVAAHELQRALQKSPPTSE